MERQFAMSSRLLSGRSRRYRSFSLVELLVVMGILAILMAVTIPAISSVVESNNMNRAGQQVADEINLAKQLSSSRNTTIEMRIFKLSGASSGYTQLQLGTNSSTGLWVPLTRLSILPQKTAISENTTLSSAFSTNTAPTMTNTGPTLNATYYPFEFRPTGIMTPVLSITNYCLAIVPARYAATTYSTLTAPIKNYAIVQINPLTSTPLVYRP